MKRCESISLRFSCCQEYNIARKKECAMLSKKVADLLNNQVNKELYSSEKSSSLDELNTI